MFGCCSLVPPLGQVKNTFIDVSDSDSDSLPAFGSVCSCRSVWRFFPVFCILTMSLSSERQLQLAGVTLALQSVFGMECPTQLLPVTCQFPLFTPLNEPTSFIVSLLHGYQLCLEYHWFPLSSHVSTHASFPQVYFRSPFAQQHKIQHPMICGGRFSPKECTERDPRQSAFALGISD